MTSATALLTAAHTFSKDEAATLYAILSNWKFRLSFHKLMHLMPAENCFYMFLDVSDLLKVKIERPRKLINLLYLVLLPLLPQAPTALNPLASHSLPSIASPGQAPAYANYPPTRVGVVWWYFLHNRNFGKKLARNID